MSWGKTIRGRGGCGRAEQESCRAGDDDCDDLDTFQPTSPSKRFLSADWGFREKRSCGRRVETSFSLSSAMGAARGASIPTGPRDESMVSSPGARGEGGPGEAPTANDRF